MAKQTPGGTLFRFRLEAQDGSGHFRRGTIEAASRGEAEAFLLEREAKFCAFRLPSTPIAPPALDSTDAAFSALPTKERAHAAIHHQDEPYNLVELEEV